MGVVSVAVVFTDLVGSTALASRVGPVGAEELRVEHFGLLRDVFGRHGGREVKNLGDGLMVAFDVPSAAVTAAAEVQQHLDRRNRSGADREPLVVRVGVSVGEADADEEGDLFGPPVVEAARLCGVAEGGQVLATEVVRALVGARSTVELRSLGVRELKGIPDPVPVCEVAWAPLAVETEAAAMPLPGRLAQVAGVFAGRAVESEALADAWKEASAGGCRGAVVAGEAGIGKTTLLSRFAQGVHAGGGVVTYGRCDEDLGVAYQPWIEASGHLVACVPDEVLAAHVADRGGVLARLVPELAQRVAVPAASSSVDPEADRYLLYGAVADLLGRVASEVGPVLVVLDDLHWADRPTTSLLRHVLADADLGGVMVVVTYRPTDVDAAHPLVEAIAALRRIEGTGFVDLVGLDDLELFALLEAIAGHDLADDAVALRDALSAETDGNPFFTLEILRHLSESGTLRQDAEGRWGSEVDLRKTGLPVSVRQVVGQRVARLGEGTGRVLRQAAVIGRDFDLDLLAELTDTGAEELLDLLDPALEAAVIENVEGERFSFAHALIEHTLYVELAPARRARAHRRIAEALEARWGDQPGARVGELAHHWAAAPVPDDAAKAVEWARRAGDRAREQLAPDEAVRWYTQALDLLEADGTVPHTGDDHLRCALLVGLGSAERQAGIPSHRQRLLDAAALAHRLGDPTLLAAAALENHRGGPALLGSVDDERVAVLDLALAAVDPDDLQVRAPLLATLAVELLWVDDPRKEDLRAEAIALARATGRPGTLCDVLIALNQLEWLVDASPDEGERGLAEALALAGDDPVRRSAALNPLYVRQIRRGDRAGARSGLVDLAATSLQQALPPVHLGYLTVMMIDLLLDGELDRAEEVAEEVMEVETGMGYPDALAAYGVRLICLRYHSGRAGELVDVIAEAVAAAIADDAPTATAYRIGLAAAQAQGGETGPARALLADLRGELAELPRNDAWLTSLAQLADLATIAGDRTAAAEVSVLLAPHRHLVSGIASWTCEGSVAHRLGCLAAVRGRIDEAVEHLTAGLEVNRRLESPIHIAAAAHDLGTVLAERDPARARALHDEAEALKASCGLAGWPGVTGRWQP